MWNLEFNATQNESNKVARFKTVEQKNRYVEAEFKDLTCKEAYIKHQSARSIKERKRTAAHLDAIRWKFYEQWNKQLHVIKSDPSGEIA